MGQKVRLLSVSSLYQGREHFHRRGRQKQLRKPHLHGPLVADDGLSEETQTNSRSIRTINSKQTHPVYSIDEMWNTMLLWWPLPPFFTILHFKSLTMQLLDKGNQTFFTYKGLSRSLSLKKRSSVRLYTLRVTNIPNIWNIISL